MGRIAERDENSPKWSRVPEPAHSRPLHLVLIPQSMQKLPTLQIDAIQVHHKTIYYREVEDHTLRSDHRCQPHSVALHNFFVGLLELLLLLFTETVHYDRLVPCKITCSCVEYERPGVQANAGQYYLAVRMS